jgi:type VI secretion system Hcp family effector
MAYVHYFENPKDSSITPTGEQRGKTNKFKDKIHILSFRYNVVAPVDVANGRPTGERRHEPVEFIMENQAATNDFVDRLCTSKKVTPDGKTAKFGFYHQNLDNGKDEMYFSIDLTEAYVHSVEFMTGLQDDDHSSGLGKETKDRGVLELVKVKLSYRKIELKHLISPTTGASDDWAT